MSVDGTNGCSIVAVDCDHLTSRAMQYRLWSAERLTPREREIIELVGQGLTDQEIAAQLCLSVRTVQNHLHRSYSKLRVNNRIAAVQIVMHKQVARAREV